MHLLAMLAEPATQAVRTANPWYLVLGFVCLAYGVYLSRRKKKPSNNSEEQVKRDKPKMMKDSNGDTSKSAFDAVAEGVADRESKKRKR